MLSFMEKIIFVAIILATFVAFSVPVYSRIRIIRAGQAVNRSKRFLRRLLQALGKIFLQRCTIKRLRVFTGFTHVLIFYGALTFDTITINHTLEGFIPDFFLFGNSSLGLFFSLCVDIFAVLVLTGVVFFAIKRFILKPQSYATSLLDSAVIYVMLTLVTLSYIYFEIFSIAKHPDTERWSFLGASFAASLQNIVSEAAISSHFHISWWLHILLVYGFIVYVPHSKYFHMFAGSVNVLVNRDEPLGELKPLNIEEAEVFGVEKSLDYTWKDLLDPFACMECGRCQDACPAFASEKPLSPKMIIYNLKHHLLDHKTSIQKRNREDIPALMDGVYSEGEIWTCTTCGACMNVCPVEIEHIPKIVGVRQSRVLMESQFPNELNSFFRNIETNSNPWGIGFSERAAWTEDLDVKLLSEHPQAEYLLWVGCAGAYDEEGKKIARSVASLLQKTGTDYAILGTEEKCCGDSARRLGNEYLFQTLAQETMELFSKYKVKKLITFCPHGYNTFKNEYPPLLEVLTDIKPETAQTIKQLEVIHHTQIIAQWIQEGKLPVKNRIKKSLTYHDSCYLGRNNNIIKEPRVILSSLGGKKFTELPNNKKNSFCCGAGGGLMWTEETLGKRINHIRTDELIDNGADIAVTSCPFCQTMLLDGLKDKNKETIQVKDIAQIVAEIFEK